MVFLVVSLGIKIHIGSLSLPAVADILPSEINEESLLPFRFIGSPHILNTNVSGILSIYIEYHIR